MKYTLVVLFFLLMGSVSFSQAKLTQAEQDTIKKQMTSLIQLEKTQDSLRAKVGSIIEDYKETLRILESSIKDSKIEAANLRVVVMEMFAKRGLSTEDFEINSDATAIVKKEKK